MQCVFLGDMPNSKIKGVGGGEGHVLSVRFVE